MSRAVVVALCLASFIAIPRIARAQGNVPAAAQQAAGSVQDFVEKYGIGVDGGVGLDPELIIFGAHGTFGPVLTPALSFRPGLDFGIGEVTTTFGINLDVLYRFPGATTQTRWTPYVGAGPNFALSHQSFDVPGTTTTVTTTSNGTTTTANGTTTESKNRFNFSDTSFDTGFNFIAGARKQNGVFFELKATAYGVTNVRLMAGFNF